MVRPTQTHPTWACSAAPRNSTWASSSNSDTNARCHCPSGVCTPSSNPSVPWPSQVMDRTTRAVRDASSSSYPTCEHTTSHLPMVYTVSPVGVCSHMRAVGLEPTRASLMKPYGPLDSTSSTSTIPPRPRGGGPVAPPDKGGVRGDRAVVSTAIESCTGLAIENCTLGGGDEPLVRRFLLCSCSLSLRG